MKPAPKFVLGTIFVILLISFTLFFTQKRSETGSNFTLISQKNKFNISFNVSENDLEDLHKFLINLGIPKDIIAGVTFELDSTSSAKLTTLTPTKFNFNVKEKRFEFTSELHRNPMGNQISIKPVKIPKETTLAIFSPNLFGYMSKRLPQDIKIKKLIDENLIKNDGNYLAVFGNKPEYALFFASDLNPEDFEEAPQEASEASKEKADENTKLYFLKTEGNQNEPTVLFKLQNNYVIASSQGAAKQVIDSQDSGNIFPKEENKASLIVKFVNQDDTDNLDGIYKFSLASTNFSSPAKLQEVAPKIKEAQLTLKGNVFSGLILVK